MAFKKFLRNLKNRIDDIKKLNRQLKSISDCNFIATSD